PSMARDSLGSALYPWRGRDQALCPQPDFQRFDVFVRKAVLPEFEQQPRRTGSEVIATFHAAHASCLGPRRPPGNTASGIAMCWLPHYSVTAACKSCRASPRLTRTRDCLLLLGQPDLLLGLSHLPVGQLDDAA